MTDLHWIDGDPQMEAIAAAVYDHCEHHDSGLVIDDPRNIAVACVTALRSQQAVLPASVDRAAGLREAADECDQRATAIDALSSSDFDEEARAVRELAAIASKFRHLADEAQQPEEALCGKTVGVGFPDHPYRPCARPAGHSEAYCRDATGQHYFLAAADQPDAEPEEAGR